MTSLGKTRNGGRRKPLISLIEIYKTVGTQKFTTKKLRALGMERVVYVHLNALRANKFIRAVSKDNENVYTWEITPIGRHYAEKFKDQAI